MTENVQIKKLGEGGIWGVGVGGGGVGGGESGFLYAHFVCAI